MIVVYFSCFDHINSDFQGRIGASRCASVTWSRGGPIRIHLTITVVRPSRDRCYRNHTRGVWEVTSLGLSRSQVVTSLLPVDQWASVCRQVRHGAARVLLWEERGVSGAGRKWTHLEPRHFRWPAAHLVSLQLFKSVILKVGLKWKLFVWREEQRLRHITENTKQEGCGFEDER